MAIVRIEVDKNGDITRGELCDVYAPLPVVRLVLLGAASWFLVVYLAGCTFQVGVGYHGKTGIDDREASQLVANRPVVYDGAISEGKYKR